MSERLYHEIACPSLTKTGPCSCQPVIVADAPEVTPAPPIRPAPEMRGERLQRLDAGDCGWLYDKLCEAEGQSSDLRATVARLTAERDDLGQRLARTESALMTESRHRNTVVERANRLEAEVARLTARGQQLEQQLEALEAKWDERAEGWSEAAREASAGCADKSEERLLMRGMNAINECINDVRALRRDLQAALPPPPDPKED